ncbi:hypothetical protein C8F01DRAFT_771506 [Mycena amicta]|nr:hypothetical protein C8F01DRAFT_771506 [Mycena amicta]
MVSRWIEERRAVDLRESNSAAQGERGGVSAQREDIARLRSQWEQAAAQPDTQVRLTTTTPVLTGPSRGLISVHNATRDGPFLGFLAANKLVRARDSATIYSIEDPAEPLTHIDVINSNLSLCIAVGPFGESLGPSKQDFHFSRHAASGTQEAGPHWNTPLHTYIQTSVFSVNAESREIIAHWANPDGDSLQVVIAHAIDRVFYTGDISAFERVLGKKTDVVAFNWAELRGE